MRSDLRNLVVIVHYCQFKRMSEINLIKSKDLMVACIREAHFKYCL